jgi:hypothetical protein
MSRTKKKEAVPRIRFEGSLNINGEVNTMLYMKCNHQIPSQCPCCSPSPWLLTSKKIVTLPRGSAFCRRLPKNRLGPFTSSHNVSELHFTAILENEDLYSLVQLSYFYQRVRMSKSFLKCHVGLSNSMLVAT